MINKNELSCILVKTFFIKKEKFVDIYKCGNLYQVVKNDKIIDSNFDLEILEESIKDAIREEVGE